MTLDKPSASLPVGTSLGESMVFGILGLRRRGKGILGAYLAAEFWRAGGNVLHFGNLTFGQQLDSIEPLLDWDPEVLRNSLLFLDEVHRLFDSRRGATVVQLLLSHGLIQSGHMGLSLMYTTQKDRRLSPDLTDQTDWVFWVHPTMSRKRRWPYKTEIVRGDDWRCPGFFKDHPHHAEHKRCPEFDHQRVVRFNLVAQEGAMVKAGSRFPGTLQCAQRYYSLNNSHQMMDSKQAILQYDSKNVREREDAKTAKQAEELVLSLAADRPQATPGDLTAYLEGSYGLELSPAQVRKMMSNLGVPKRTQNGRQVYDLAAYAEEVQTR